MRRFPRLFVGLMALTFTSASAPAADALVGAAPLSGPTAGATPECASVDGLTDSVYASPYGSPEGDGSSSDPLDLFTAFHDALHYGERLVLCEGSFTTSELVVDAPLVIVGSSSKATIVTSTRPTEHPAFHVDAGGSLSIDGMLVVGSRDLPGVTGSPITIGNDLVALPPIQDP